MSGGSRGGWWALVVLVAVAVAVTTSACAEMPQRRYYTLSFPSEGARGDGAAPLHPLTLRVDRFDAALPFDRSQIVYRESPYQFSYYSYRLWAAKPQRMLREVALRHLQTSALVRNVTRDYGQDLPDYELSAQVEALEEYDSGDVWYGHLAMSFELVRFEDQSVVWSYRFDRKKRVSDRKLVLVVRAVSRIAEEEMRRVVAQLDHVLARERGVSPTLEVPAPTRDEVVVPSDEEPSTREQPQRERPREEEPEDEEEIITPDEPAAPGGGGSDEDLITPDGPGTSGGEGAAAP
ncbi:MAG: ABC-type transport auxiliary lipoprotein family protein [Myxococcota bacterium]